MLTPVLRAVQPDQVHPPVLGFPQRLAGRFQAERYARAEAGRIVAVLVGLKSPIGPEARGRARLGIARPLS